MFILERTRARLARPGRDLQRDAAGKFRGLARRLLGLELAAQPRDLRVFLIDDALETLQLLLKGVHDVAHAIVGHLRSR
jgi:hypothetical protein